MRTEIKVTLEHTGLEGRFPTEVETTAYRIIQEALTNVARHAHVKVATVRLWTTRDALNIQIVDKGVGFSCHSPEYAANTGGLAGMEERAKLLDGTLTIESGPNTGTFISAELPLIGLREVVQP